MDFLSSKTRITASLLAILQALQASGVLELTLEQLTSGSMSLVALALIFLRNRLDRSAPPGGAARA